MNEYKYILTIHADEKPTMEQIFDISNYALDRLDYIGCAEVDIDPLGGNMYD